MSEGEQSGEVYAVRVKHGLAREMEDYVESREGSKSRAVRDLLKLGLEAEELGIRPGEYSDRVESLEDELKDAHQERKWFALSASLSAGGLLILLTSVAVVDILSNRFGGAFQSIQEAVAVVSVLLLLSGVVVWVSVLVGPIITDISHTVDDYFG